MKQAFSWSILILHISLIECSYQRLPHCWVLTTLFPQLITEALMSPYTELTRHTLIGFCCHKDTSEWCLANGHWPPYPTTRCSETCLVISVPVTYASLEDNSAVPLGEGKPRKYWSASLQFYSLPLVVGATNYFSECAMSPPKKM